VCIIKLYNPGDEGAQDADRKPCQFAAVEGFEVPIPRAKYSVAVDLTSLVHSSQGIALTYAQ